jgi:predicted nucleotidyltransferase component of viral defense system
MKKNRAAAEAPHGAELEHIKKTAVVAMFADDELMDLLVLKGGNAMDLVHQMNSRASIDLDFSTGDDLDFEQTLPKVQAALVRTFEAEGYKAFDIKMTSRPGKMPDDLAAFWGGYLVEFKLIKTARAEELGRDLIRMRREAIMLGEGPKFTMDISRHEYTADKQEHELLGYMIYVYSPQMIVCEKLRAICQQMPDYAEVIQRKGLGNQRARDFIDIEALVKKFDIDIRTDDAQAMVRQMFELKRVPLALLGKIESTHDVHALGYDEVKAAMKPGVKLEDFDYYFNFVVDLCRGLEPLRNV